MECTIYLETTWKTFLIVIAGSDKVHEIEGHYRYLGHLEVSLAMKVLNKRVELELRADSTASRLHRAFGLARLLGNILIEGNESGCCEVQNQFGTDEPLIRVSTKVPDCQLRAFRENDRYAVCPLMVYGVRDCEIVLEDYDLIGEERRAELKRGPMKGKKRDYQGTCKTSRPLYDPLPEHLVPISVVVAAHKFIVRDYYMSTGGP